MSTEPANIKYKTVYVPGLGMTQTETSTKYESFSPELNFIEMRISMLEEQVKDLRDKQFKQILLHNLRSSRLILKQPLSVSVEKRGAEIVVSCSDIDLYGVGETEQEAIVDFSENLDDFFYLLKEEGEKKLGPQMLCIWRFIKKLIVEINATKGKTSRKHI